MPHAIFDRKVVVGYEILIFGLPILGVGFLIGGIDPIKYCDMQKRF